MVIKRLTSTNWILLGILLLALGVRVVGIGWGLPLDPYTGYDYRARIGWYDAQSGQHLMADQADNIILPVTLAVE